MRFQKFSSCFPLVRVGDNGYLGTWDSGRKNKKDAEDAEAQAPATKKAKKGGSAVEVHVDNLNKLSSEEEKEN